MPEHPQEPPAPAADALFGGAPGSDAPEPQFDSAGALFDSTPADNLFGPADQPPRNTAAAPDAPVPTDMFASASELWGAPTGSDWLGAHEEKQAEPQEAAMAAQQPAEQLQCDSARDSHPEPAPELAPAPAPAPAPEPATAATHEPTVESAPEPAKEHAQGLFSESTAELFPAPQSQNEPFAAPSDPFAAPASAHEPFPAPTPIYPQAHNLFGASKTEWQDAVHDAPDTATLFGSPQAPASKHVLHDPTFAIDDGQTPELEEQYAGHHAPHEHEHHVHEAYENGQGDSGVEHHPEPQAEGQAESHAQEYAPEDYAPEDYTEGYAPEGYLPEGYAGGYAGEYAPDGYAPEAYAPEGHVPESYAPEGYAPEGYAHEGYAHEGYAPEGYAHEGYAHEGYAHEGYAPEGYAPEGHVPESYAPEGSVPEGYAPEGYSPEGYAPEGYAPEGHVPESYAPEGYAPESYAPEGHVPEGHLPEGYDRDQFVGENNTADTLPSDLFGADPYRPEADDTFIPETGEHYKPLDAYISKHFEENLHVPPDTYEEPEYNPHRDMLGLDVHGHMLTPIREAPSLAEEAEEDVPKDGDASAGSVVDHHIVLQRNLADANARIEALERECSMLHDAAAARDALQAENARLREQLEREAVHHAQSIDTQLSEALAKLSVARANTEQGERELQQKDAALAQANARITELEAQFARSAANSEHQRSSREGHRRSATATLLQTPQLAQTEVQSTPLPVRASPNHPKMPAQQQHRRHESLSMLRARIGERADHAPPTSTLGAGKPTATNGRPATDQFSTEALLFCSSCKGDLIIV